MASCSGWAYFARALSPYQFNPFDLNPLREALAAEIDFKRLRAQSPMKLLASLASKASGRASSLVPRGTGGGAVLRTWTMTS